MDKFKAELKYQKGLMFYDEKTNSTVPSPATLEEIPELSSEHHEVLAAVLGDHPVPSSGEFLTVAFFRVLDEDYSPNPMTIFVGVTGYDTRDEAQIDREVSELEHFLARRSKILAKGNASAATVVYQTLRLEQEVPGV